MNSRSGKIHMTQKAAQWRSRGPDVQIMLGGKLFQDRPREQGLDSGSGRYQPEVCVTVPAPQ